MEKIKIIATNDGSFSIYNEALDETYHSRHGAVRESQHVFISQGLMYFGHLKKAESIHILEVGFGTGLNALLTLNESFQENRLINYSALETNPLEKEIWSQLYYPDPHLFFDKIHSATWSEWITLSENFKLRKIYNSIHEEVLGSSEFDLIYFDAFAPGKQPDMWTINVFEKIVNAMKSGAVFVTYCAKGQLKRDLKSVGLLVESLPGPPGKREMVRAIKP